MDAAITLTYGEQAENHAGMEVRGSGLAAKGFTIEELEGARDKFLASGLACELINLSEEMEFPCEEACVLVVRNAVKVLSGADAAAVYKEQVSLEWDTKAWMRGRVVNKHARYNLCYDSCGQLPDYKDKKGRVIPFTQVPLTAAIRANLPKFFGNKADNLQVEGNLYYGRECGIGLHGDGERKRVIGVRLGRSMPLVYYWFLNSKAISPRSTIQLNHGDVYVMSEKASGHDWLKKKIPTLRHAAGAEKYLKLRSEQVGGKIKKRKLEV